MEDNKLYFFVYRDRESNTFGVYRQPGLGDNGQRRGQSLVEGGFFSKHAALIARDWWERNRVQAEQK
jgi:hypothetical protein